MSLVQQKHYLSIFKMEMCHSSGTFLKLRETFQWTKEKERPHVECMLDSLCNLLWSTTCTRPATEPLAWKVNDCSNHNFNLQETGWQEAKYKTERSHCDGSWATIHQQELRNTVKLECWGQPFAPGEGLGLLLSSFLKDSTEALKWLNQRI